MGLKVDLSRAQDVLDKAVEWARSERPVPNEWSAWTERIDASPSKTFTPALGTALLAKATNPAVDALALKASSGRTAYSARAVSEKVLVPGAVSHGYNLRATGRQPLNNQPFFRYDRIDTIDRIHQRARPFLPDLISACEEINELDAGGALAALAAFLRVRLAAAQEDNVRLGTSDFSVRRLVELAEEFIASNPEGGRRGQAFVAAAFDLAFPSVQSRRINDPSRRFPGDVQILDGKDIVLAVEVRQKPVTYIEALQFAESLRKQGVSTGLMTLLGRDQPRLDGYDLMVDADRMHGVLLTAVHDVRGLLTAAFTWSGRSLAPALNEFPRRMLVRLEEIDASRAGLQEWADLFD